MRWRVSLMMGLGLLLACSAAQAVTWEGLEWTTFGAPTTAVNAATGNLEITNTGTWGAVHINTSAAYRAAAAPWVEVKFLDAGSGIGPQLWMEKEGSPNAAWTQFGAWDGTGTYYVYWWNVDTDAADFVNTAVARDAGERTLLMGMCDDGEVEFLLDDELVFRTSGEITPAYFGDFYLAGHTDTVGSTAVFTSFAMGDGYESAVAPVPEPATMLALTSAVAGLGGYVRRRLH